MADFIKNVIDIFKEYIIPFITIVLAYYTYKNEKEQRKINDQLSTHDLFIKEYEAEEIKRKLNEDQEPKLTCNVIRDGKGKYLLKLANLGKSRAINVNVSIPKEYNVFIFEGMLPYEYLDPRESFNVRIGVYLQSHPKFNVSINWENEEGKKFKIEELKSIL